MGEASLPVCVRLGNSNGKCAIHMAAWRGDATAVAELLRLGASVNAITIRGQSALHFAAGKRRDAVIDLLIDEGAKARIITVKGETPCGLALKCRVSESVLRRLQAAEAAETDWIDFSGYYRARAHRRCIMAQLGTIIFSTGGGPDDDEEDDDDQRQGEDSSCGADARPVAVNLEVEDIKGILVGVSGWEENGPCKASAPMSDRERGRRVFIGLLGLAREAIKTVKQDPLLLSRRYIDLLRQCLSPPGRWEQASAQTAGDNVLIALIQVAMIASPPARSDRRAFRLLASALPRAIHHCRCPSGEEGGEPNEEGKGEMGPRLAAPPVPVQAGQEVAGCGGQSLGVGASACPFPNEGAGAEAAAACALEAAISRRGGEAVLEELVCGAADADVALAVAAALR